MSLAKVDHDDVSLDCEFAINLGGMLALRNFAP